MHVSLRADRDTTSWKRRKTVTPIISRSNMGNHDAVCTLMFTPTNEDEKTFV